MGMLLSKPLGSTIALIGLLLTTSLMHGQDTVGGIAGKVIDQDFGDGLRSVSVKVEGLETENLIFTDLEGRYQVRGIPAGTYNLVFEKANFQTARITGVEVPAGSVFSLDVPMQAIGADFTLDVFEITVELP
jgi:hypothetical protein